MEDPVVERFFLRRFETRIMMATTTAVIRIRPAIAIPMAKLRCEMQNVFGS
jgi:hypothetical protein